MDLLKVDPIGIEPTTSTLPVQQYSGVGYLGTATDFYLAIIRRGGAYPQFPMKWMNTSPVQLAFRQIKKLHAAYKRPHEASSRSTITTAWGQFNFGRLAVVSWQFFFRVFVHHELDINISWSSFGLSPFF